MGIDVEKLLAPVSEDMPCGEDVTYDSEMLDLEKLAEGTKETQFSEGEEADWRQVRNLALSLTARSKHLRVMILLLLSNLKQEGAEGLRDGMSLLRRSLETYWDSLYPQLDPDDDNDPTERINILSAISPPPDVFSDPLKIKEHVMDLPLAQSRQAGRFSLRDILRATGELPAVEGGPDMSLISGAFSDTPPEQLASTQASLQQALEDLSAMDNFLGQTVGSSHAPNLDVLKGILKQALHHLAQYAGGAVVESAGGDADGPSASSAGVAPGGGTGGAALSGEIRSTQDVIKALDKILQYYQRSEPSSPLPILIERAKRLVGKSFKDILSDLTPDAMGQLEIFIGHREDSSRGDDDY